MSHSDRASSTSTVSGQTVRAWVISALIHCIALLLMTLTWWAVSSPSILPVLHAGLSERPADEPIVVLEEDSAPDLADSAVLGQSVFAGGGSQSDGDAFLANGAAAGGRGSGSANGEGADSLLGLGLHLEGGEDGAQFYGLKAEGRRFVFVVDCSGSMEGTRFYRALDELRSSILSLRRAQSFFVYFYSDDAYPMPAEGLLTADGINRRRILRWIDKAKARGGTYPLRALQGALEKQPDAVFFLTDGEFDEATVAAVDQADRSPKIPIHAICIESEQGAKLLQTISQQSGGSFRYVR